MIRLWLACSVPALLALFLALPAQAALTDNTDGTVTDTVTGLMWDKCSWGRNDTDCSGGATTRHSWAQALGVAVTANTASYKGHADWRLPNKNELESLVDLTRYNSFINPVLQNTPAGFYWSSTNRVIGRDYAWFVDFYGGNTILSIKTYSAYVRLVRGGQSFDSFDAFPSTTVTSSANPSTVGASVTLTATVNSAGSATGTVAFKDGGTDITGCAAQSVTAGTATCATSALTQGSHTLTAVYSGDSNYGASTSANFTQTVNAAAAAAAAAAPAAPSVTVAPGNAQATLTFATPADNGAALSGYTVTLGGGASQTLTLAGVTQGTTVTAGGYTATITSVAAGNTVITVTGLTNSTGYTFAVGATNSAGTTTSATSASVTPAANGTCGTANGAATAFMPAVNLLCAAGATSAVTNASPWTWSCAGSGGGSTAQCSAPNETIPTGSGVGRAIISGGTWVVDYANSAGFIRTTGDPKSPPDLPAGYTFPQGLFDFTLTGGGGSATVTITYPPGTTFPPGTVYWKYGPTSGNHAPHWYQFPGAVIAGNTITLTLPDGDLGDDDYTANGTITDPGGPGVSGATGIPTLSEWGMIVLSSLLMLGALVPLRRRRL